MKNLKVKIIFFSGLILLMSCSKDFLTEEPKDALFANTLFNTRDGLQQGLVAVYSLARRERTETIASFETGSAWKAGTDVAWGNYTFNSLRTFDEYGANMTSSSDGVNTIWNWLYDVVNASNTIITRAESPEIDFQGANESENLANKNLLVAQARLLRAWAYRHLTYSWGDVPLSTTEIDGDNFKTYFERVDVNIVRQQMEEDLLFAEEHLPDDYNDPLILSSAVAQHYLAELYLTMGDFQKAEQKAEAAIENPNFSLITSRFGSTANLPGVPFMDQFQRGNGLPSSGNTETLWTLLNAPDLPGTAEIAMRRTWVNRYYNITVDDEWAFNQYGGRGIGRMAHTLYVEDLYEDEDDRYSKYAISKFYLKQEGGDTLFTKTPTFSAWKKSDPFFPATKKWDYVEPERPTNAGQYNNMVYLRLAETYLLAAEAELGLGKTQEAADHINALRERANATPITAGDVDIELILDERAMELLSEEHRRYTLARLGLLISRTQEFNKFSAIEEKNKLWPIPQDFIDSNEGPTEQNPGY
jgi:tetratricopeptide (TPR) repeat protein